MAGLAAGSTQSRMTLLGPCDALAYAGWVEWLATGFHSTSSPTPASSAFKRTDSVLGRVAGSNVSVPDRTPQSNTAGPDHHWWLGYCAKMAGTPRQIRG